MDIKAFGTALVQTKDLDPVYVAIVGAKLPGPQLCRCLLAYWCFYHLGSAAWLSEQEGEDYWRWMRVAATNMLPPPGPEERWPRMPERRHFRGVRAEESVGFLSRKTPVERVWGLTAFKTEKEIMDKVQEWPLFGPWIAFKAADMIERCGRVPIKFSGDIGLVYDEPRSALDMLVDLGGVGTPEDWYAALLQHFSNAPAPPLYDRDCGPQEVETILCKWKSHMRGHYPVGKDTKETRHALEGWGDTAHRMLLACPEEVIGDHKLTRDLWERQGMVRQKLAH
jgi:hypothetical protein